MEWSAWNVYLSSMNDEEKDHASAFPLHALASAYSSGAVVDDDPWLQRFNHLIRLGCDVNAVDHDMTVWEAMIPAAGAPFHRIDQATAILVQAGFNPLLPMTQKAETAPHSFLTDCFIDQNIGDAYSGMGIGAILGLARRETPDPLRSEHGGNALHVLCREAPDAIGGVLEHFSFGPQPHSGRFALPHEWLTATDADGMTPLAWLWSTTGAPAILGGCPGPNSLAGIADASQTLMGEHDGLLNLTTHGKPIWQVMSMHLEGHADTLVRSHGALMARLQQAALEANTSAVQRQAGRGSPRL